MDQITIQTKENITLIWSGVVSKKSLVIEIINPYEWFRVRNFKPTLKTELKTLSIKYSFKLQKLVLPATNCFKEICSSVQDYLLFLLGSGMIL